MCSLPRLAATDSVVHNASTTLLLHATNRRKRQTIPSAYDRTKEHSTCTIGCAIASCYLLPSYGNLSPSLPTDGRPISLLPHTLSTMLCTQSNGIAYAQLALAFSCKHIIHIVQSRFQQPAMCCLASIILAHNSLMGKRPVTFSLPRSTVRHLSAISRMISHLFICARC